MKNRNFRSFAGVALAAALLAGCAGQSTDDTSGGASAGGGDSYGSSGYQSSGNGSAYDQASANAAALASLQRVFYFDFDRAELRPEVQAELDKYVNILRTGDQTLRLEGHADERGTTEYNLALAERRANSIQNYLVVNGVSGDRIETVSYGEERPAETGHDESSYAQNRRVEVVLR